MIRLQGPKKTKAPNSPSSKPPNHPVYDWDILALDVIHHNLSYLGVLIPIPQEQEVSTLERRLHATGQHDDDWRRRIAQDGQPFPEHERGREHEREVEQLRELLPHRQAGERGQHLFYSSFTELGF